MTSIAAHMPTDRDYNFTIVTDRAELFLSVS